MTSNPSRPDSNQNEIEFTLQVATKTDEELVTEINKMIKYVEHLKGQLRSRQKNCSGRTVCRAGTNPDNDCRVLGNTKINTRADTYAPDAKQPQESPSRGRSETFLVDSSLYDPDAEIRYALSRVSTSLPEFEL